MKRPSSFPSAGGAPEVSLVRERGDRDAQERQAPSVRHMHLALSSTSMKRPDRRHRHPARPSNSRPRHSRNRISSPPRLIWIYGDAMGVRVISPFATIKETAKILGVSPRRAKQLEKLINGTREIPVRTRNGLKEASAAFKFKKSASRSARNGSPNRPQTRRGTQKRAKKAKAAR